MTFQRIFPAVVFGLLGPWVALLLLLRQGWLPRTVGVLVLLSSVSIVVGLMRCEPVARWAGLAGGVLLALLGAAQVWTRGWMVDHALVVASVLTCVLLLLPSRVPPPSTGIEAPSPPPDAGRRSLFGWISLASIAGIVVAIGYAWTESAPRAASHLPQEGPVAWHDFATGLEKARKEGKLALVDFYAVWCGPCKLMDQKTFRDPEVVERLERVVPIRIDSEETKPRNGYVGVRLAEQYGVMSYPTLMLLDGSGKVVAAKSGFQSPRQFVRWLDDQLLRAGATTGE